MSTPVHKPALNTRLNRGYSLQTMTDGRDSELFYNNFEKITE